VLGVVLVSQLVGTVLALILAVARGETMPLASDVPWSICGGLTGGVGIVALYRGLAVGRMGVVAPVTGVLAASIPVVFGVVLEGLPTPLVVVGIGLAIVAVVLVSRVDDGRAGPSGLGLALLAGVAIGAFGVTISQISEGHAFGPLTMIRAAEALLIGAVIVVGPGGPIGGCCRRWPVSGSSTWPATRGSSSPFSRDRWRSRRSSRRSTR
jgi:uncharacterized membrane protein